MLQCDQAMRLVDLSNRHLAPYGRSATERNEIRRVNNTCVRIISHVYILLTRHMSDEYISSTNDARDELEFTFFSETVGLFF